MGVEISSGKFLPIGVSNKAVLYMVAVQELLGHTRSDMTQRYAKYAKTGRLRDMLEEAGF